MKTRPALYVSALLLLLVAFAKPIFSATPYAPASGPSANGAYKFTLDDEFSKFLEFSATLDERGAPTGQMTFRDEGFIPERDADEPAGDKGESRTELYLRASLDSLSIERNRAVIGGTVTDSSERSFIGRWVQLVVEDNGDNTEAPDRLSWRVGRPEEGGWTPADAELKDDEGAWWKWWATDAEFKDDAGIPSTNIIPGSNKGGPVFPISSYEFAEMRSCEGQINVLP